jgi:hypothetical protein
MARSIDDVFENLNAARKRVPQLKQAIEDQAINQEPALSELSTSGTAIWRLWCFVVAVCIWIHETLWDEAKAEIEAIAERAVPGTAPWLVNEIHKFQYSTSQVYTIVFNDRDKPVYDTVDASKRILTNVAVTELQNGKVRIKVTKDNNGQPGPLNTSEKQALKGYIDQIKPAGLGTELISKPPDLFVINYEVYYDPVNTVASIQPEVEAAINDYLTGLDFNGIFYSERLRDAVQAVAGVIDVKELSITANGTPVDRYRILNAGYGKVDPNNALASTVQYIPSPTQ